MFRKEVDCEAPRWPRKRSCAYTSSKLTHQRNTISRARAHLVVKVGPILKTCRAAREVTVIVLTGSSTHTTSRQRCVPECGVRLFLRDLMIFVNFSSYITCAIRARTLINEHKRSISSFFVKLISACMARGVIVYAFHNIS